MKSTGQRFKEIRQSLQLSQEEFGNNLGLSSQGISNIEKDKSFLTLEKIQALRNFDINLNYLIYGEGEMFNKMPEPIEKYSKELEQFILHVLKKNNIMQ